MAGVPQRSTVRKALVPRVMSSGGDGTFEGWILGSLSHTLGGDCEMPIFLSLLLVWDVINWLSLILPPSISTLMQPRTELLPMPCSKLQNWSCFGYYIIVTKDWQIELLFRHGEIKDQETTATGKSLVILTDFQERGHAMTRKPTCGSTRVSQSGERRRNVSKRFIVVSEERDTQGRVGG